MSPNLLENLPQVGFGMALKPHHAFSSLLLNPNDVINFEQKCDLVCQISSWDCNSVYIGETRPCVRSENQKKREHTDVNKTFNTKKSALSQHVMDFDHRIDWDNVKIAKSESHTKRRLVAENFLLYQKACLLNVDNRNNGANFLAVLLLRSSLPC